MKRADFLKELGLSLADTLKSVYAPIVEEEVESIETAADRALGIHWVDTGLKEKNRPFLEMKFIEGMPVILQANETNMRAFSGICPVCSHIITLTALYSTGKCFNCEHSFNFLADECLELHSLPAKVKEGSYFVSLNHVDGRSGCHA